MSSPFSNNAVLKAIAATAATTLVVVGIFFFLFKRFVIARCHKKKKASTIFLREDDEVTLGEFMNFGGNMKGLIVEENGVDVFYLRELEGGQLETSFPKVAFNPSFEDEKEKRVDVRVERPRKSQSQEVPLLSECSEGIPLEVVKTIVQIPTPPIILEKETLTPPPPPPKKIPLPPSPALSPPFLPAKRSLAPPPHLHLLRQGIRLRMLGTGQRTLKPLHWNKVTTNTDHSMVWDKIIDGSFRFEDDLMETLFGYANTKNKSLEGDYVLPSSSKSNNVTPTQIFILEPRKSQNIAIVLRSIVISRREILDALFEGQGLSVDTLEKLTKMTPTKEEEAKILQFNGNTTKLADSESFLYHILKVVPSAFTRFNAMLFRTNYDPDILYLKGSLQALELGRRLINRNHNLGRRNGQSIGTTNSDSLIAEDRDRESLMLGLPVLEDLSTELSIVKKVAIIEYDNFINMCSTLGSRVTEIRQLMRNCGNDERGVGFVREMKGFLEECEEELMVVRGEQTRVMELVKRTTKYYQAGASISTDKGSHPLQLFVMVKDFLGMVDQVCADIYWKIQKKNETAPLGSSPPSTKTLWRLSNFHSHFMLDMSRTTSNESSDDF
ncbi:hypothetical protein I3843_11G032300 [Carya illinoinensis]|nr:hypothetical protein I3843_11G032300 [Carya illinoinensis]